MVGRFPPVYRVVTVQQCELGSWKVLWSENSYLRNSELKRIHENMLVDLRVDKIVQILMFSHSIKGRQDSKQNRVSGLVYVFWISDKLLYLTLINYNLPLESFSLLHFLEKIFICQCIMHCYGEQAYEVFPSCFPVIIAVSKYTVPHFVSFEPRYSPRQAK